MRNLRKSLHSMACLMMLVVCPKLLHAYTSTTIVNNGPAAGHLDFVFLGDGYLSTEMDKYHADVDKYVAHLLAESPFHEYQRFINVHRVDAVSNQSGVSDRCAHVTVDTVFRVAFDNPGDGSCRLLMVGNQDEVYRAASVAPGHDMIVVISNTDRYGGAGGAISVFTRHIDGAEIMLHEIGHTLAHFGEEYAVYPKYTGGEPTDMSNATTYLARNNYKWDAWIEPTTPLPTTTTDNDVPGKYEGGALYYSGIYRPTYNSKMRNLYRPYDRYNYSVLVSNLMDFVAPDTTDPTVSLFVNGASCGGIVNSSNVTLNLSAGDPETLVKSYRVSASDPNYSDTAFKLASNQSTFNQDIPLTLPGGEGLKKIYVQVINGYDRVTNAVCQMTYQAPHENQAPTIATHAAAIPNPVAGVTSSLSVLGADEGGEPNLIYTWTTLDPSNAGVTFSVNGTNAAKNTAASFTKVGSFHFGVTIQDSGGKFVTDDVIVIVAQTLTSIDIAPTSGALVRNQSLQLTATTKDQFGNVITSSPPPTWSVTSGGGTITADGLYTAGLQTGDVVIAAQSGSVTSTVHLTVINTAPAVATAASATPAHVSDISTNLNVLGSDDAGEENLSYTWTVLDGQESWVTFSANGTNAAKNTVATFGKAGDYRFHVTIKDAEGLNSDSEVTVTVDQRIKTVLVTPSSLTLPVKQTAQFSATFKDQFDNNMSVTTSVVWSVDGSGSVSSDGLFTAGTAAGLAHLTATVGSVSATVDVTVTDDQTITPPIITQQPLSQSVVVGNRVRFSVGATSADSLSYQWRRRETRNGSWYDLTGEAAASYSLIPVSSDNGAQFQCQVTNGAGSTNSDIATLTVTSAVEDGPSPSPSPSYSTKAYPNPIDRKNNDTVVFKAPPHSQVTIFNPLGENITEFQIDDLGNGSWNIKNANFAGGMYVYRVKTPAGDVIKGVVALR